jgi:hypothetical protein
VTGKNFGPGTSRSSPTLFAPPPPDGNLGPRQALVLEQLRSAPDGLDDTTIGVHLHRTTGCRFCTPDRPCRYAAGDARAVLRALRKRGLARFRCTTGNWHATSGVHDPHNHIPF